MSDEPTVEGSCQCGSVRFRISGTFERFFLCHCSRCRKDTGSAHGANLFSATASIEWLSGRDNIRTYRIPETRHEKAFCIECGSALPRVAGNGAMLIVPAGSLDEAIGIRPTSHICFASRADWDDHLEDVPKLDGLPGSQG
jgi:hypothetical protein